ncbi:MAG: NAD(P)-dependent oxidoreductase [Spirochaetes bacterium]|nr:NAD(P)-dependent oxidoreductase [Spirochaetota bacterium]
MDKWNIGWIGLGVMGKSMVSHFISNGFKVFINTRTKEKAYELINKGAIYCDGVDELVLKSNIIFTMVGFPEDVEDVYFSNNKIIDTIQNLNKGELDLKDINLEKEFLEKSGKKKIFIDMTTTKPSIAKKIYNELNSLNCGFLDAPVSGGDVGAKNATLSIMVGGDKNIFEFVKPYFEIIGKNIVYQGESGSGQNTKMCNQIVIAGTMIGVCEALIYAYKAGLDIEKVLFSITKGAAGCWTLDNLAPRIIRGDFNPGFFVEHFVKDMGIALEEASRMNISLPGLALVHQLYISLKAQGDGKLGTQALYKALKRLNNIS